MLRHPWTSPARLLKSSTAIISVRAAVIAPPLALALLTGSAGWQAPEAMADTCAPATEYACYYVIQPDPPPAGPNNGDGGAPGAAAPAVEVDVPAATYAAGQEVRIEVHAQDGGPGRNGHYADVGTPGGLAGAGGQGGAGNTLTVTMQPGTVVNSATTIVAAGGNGGQAGHASHQNPEPLPGNGGQGGNVVAGTQSAPLAGSFTNPGGPALSVTASGGAGAPGTNWDPGPPLGESSNYDGGDGGTGGPGGTVNVVFQGSVSGATAGILALSQGGNGGDGGESGGSGADGAQGGNGGAGGLGNDVSVTVLSGARTDPNAGTGIVAQSFGGQGGVGGQGHDASSGGIAGKGADAGTVFVENHGTVQTGLFDAPGILMQSFGGAGGSGGSGGGWGASGGNGGTGGSGSSVQVVAAAESSIATAGSNSPGILLQSIGGGGGNGGDSNGWLAIGGDGAGAGHGGSVIIYKSTSGLGSSPITTSGERSTGILAQSIGGGGGNGGNASSSAVGPINLVIGGSGAGGGDGGPVQAATTGDITTSGLHSSGMVLQSIGGGGGNGGSAYSGTTSAAVGAAVSLGGNGGGGGNGGPVGLIVRDPTTGQTFPTSTGRILTTGANAHGILGQSLGGGGGTGGLSGAKATTYAVPTDEIPIPTISVGVAIGGSGGTGGGGSSVTLENTGLIATAGGGSIGMAGQSVGGGGGSGGDASATSSAKGGDDSPVNISSSTAIGGKGGGGGAGGAVSLTNGGLIFTRGEAADAVLAQSIGGGGGNGGTGDAQAKSSGDNTNISSTVALGGTGGSGGNAGPVTVTNTGALLSLGDGAMGILAQAVGGGGGRGGGAAGTSNGSFTASVGVGGNGAVGGSTTQPNNANAVTVSNSGTLVTFGADAPGIVAQSIGGGGGLGGKSASTLGNKTNTRDGGNGASGNVNAAMSSLNSAFQSGGEAPVNQYNSVSGLIGVSNQALGNVTATRRLGDDPAGDAEDLENLGESGGESGDDSSSTSVTVHVNVGGRGGAGGSAGGVLVTNSAGGSIGTVGAMSDGILAQAIGGGGGRGGAAVSSITSAKVNEGDQQGNVPISVGGRGGAGGNAGNVEVDNGGSVTTIGAQSLGIVAQSIAGGGGMAGTSAAKVQGNNADNTSVLSLPIAIGADGGGGGTSGTVTVNNAGAITTRSHDAIGILAQSITGGGGIVRTRSSDASDNNGGGAVATGGSYGINLTFGGSCGTVCSTDPSKEAQPGTAGAVVVNHTGSITTGNVAANGARSGSNAHGILAQSIGGGGGVALGGTPNGTNFFGTGMMTGDAGSVTVSAGNASGAAGSGSIATSGQGAVAILAQSIGGGGGLAGDTGMTAQRAGFQPSGNHSGNGGPVLVQVGSTATLSTGAGNTPVILVQSIGGGGGRITNDGYGAYDGTAGGTGTGGAVTIDVGGQVLAGGAASPGIFAESVGQSTSSNPTGGSAVQINVLQGGTVQGGTNFNPNDGYGAAIYIVGGSTAQTSPAANNINNRGTITSLGGTGTLGTAVYSTGGWTNIYNQGGGTITGSINLENGGGGGNLVNYGTLNPGPIMKYGTGTLSNSGMLSIGGIGTVGTTAMTGNLVQGPTGRLVVDSNHGTGEADRLDVQGSVRLGGTVEMHPAVVANRAVTVLTASEGVNLDAGLATTRTHLFRFDAQQRGNSLQVQPRAEFAAKAAALGANQQGVAAHLQDLWDRGASMDAGFTALAGVRDGDDYARSLNSLSGQTVGAIAAFRLSTSRNFVSNMFNECPSFEGAGLTQSEASCGWTRIFGSFADQNGTGGALGYQTSAWTFQTGGQKQIAPNWFLGGSAAYESSVFRGDAGSSKVSGDSLLLGATLRYQNGPWQAAGALDFGYGWYESQRTVEAGSFRASARAKPDAWHLGAHTRLAYTLPFGGAPEGWLAGWYLQPRLDLHLNHVRGGGYTETGAGPFDLSVESEGATSFTANPAVEIGGRIRLSEGAVLRPFASAGVELIANGDWAAAARFAGQPASPGFRASTPAPDVLGKFTVGADLLNTTNWDFRVQYTAEAGDGYTSHTGLGRLAYRF